MLKEFASLPLMVLILCLLIWRVIIEREVVQANIDVLEVAAFASSNLEGNAPYVGLGLRNLPNDSAEAVRDYFENALSEQRLCSNLRERELRWQVSEQTGSIAASHYVRVIQARVLICDGKYREAADLLSSQHPSFLRNLALGDVYRHLDEHTDSLDYFTSIACLGRSEWCVSQLIETFQASKTLYVLEQAQRYRSCDLVVNYYVFNYSPSEMKRRSAADLLRRPTVTCLFVTDPTLQQHYLEVIPRLIEQGIWDSDLAHRILSLFVWQQQRSGPHTHHLLRHLRDIDPLDDDPWVSMLQELHKRSVQNIPAACLVTSQPSDSDLEWVTIQADLLNKKPSLSSNIFSRGGWDAIDMSEGIYWDESQYYLGEDSLASHLGNCSLRIDGIWTLRGSAREPSWAGFRFEPEDNETHRIELQSHSYYLFAWSYHTANLEGTPAAFVGLSNPVYSSFPRHLPLVASPDEWKRQRVLIRTSEPVTLTAILRLFGSGTVWFSDVLLSKIHIDES